MLLRIRTHIINRNKRSSVPVRLFCAPFGPSFARAYTTEATARGLCDGKVLSGITLGSHYRNSSGCKESNRIIVCGIFIIQLLTGWYTTNMANYAVGMNNVGLGHLVGNQGDKNTCYSARSSALTKSYF